jgi:hypothetical protein
MRRGWGVLLVVAVLAGCGDDGAGPSSSTPAVETAGDADSAQRFPDVIAAEAEQIGGLWTISVTISSPYDTPERYADAWRVLGPDGYVYGERVLVHDHQDEQPFTRSLDGVRIPDEVEVVTIEARDLVHGWGGTTLELTLPR